VIISQLDQTRTSFPHFSLSMLDAWKSCSWRSIFGLNGISRTSRVCKTLRVAVRLLSALSIAMMGFIDRSWGERARHLWCLSGETAVWTSRRWSTENSRV